MKIFLNYKNTESNNHSIMIMIEKERGYLHLMLIYDGNTFHRIRKHSRGFEITQRLRNHITSYQEIKAIKTAELISNAVKIFPKGYDTDLETRVAAIEKADENTISGWEDLDELFFTNETEEDVVTLIVNYIKANESQFGN